MDLYSILRFFHVVGVMAISAGLIGVFVADMRSRLVSDVRLYAHAVTLIAVFYDGFVVPGAILILVSGTWLIIEFHGGWDVAGEPWLAGMVALFAFEFVEGNTITRVYFMRLRRLARDAAEKGRVTSELVRARSAQFASFAHFLDLPLLMVIVSLGVFRPMDWSHFLVGTALAIAIGTALNIMVPRLYPWAGESPRS